MREFDVAEGTMLEGKAMARQKQRIGTILNHARRRLHSSNGTVRMLDVGCSSGSVLQVAHAAGLEVYGVEPAPEAAATARKQGFDVFTGFLEDAAFPDHHFDMVTLFEVIEHLAEPLPLAREVFRILKPGGIWVIGTGNADSWTLRMQGAHWEYLDIDRHGGHISFFNPHSIRLLARRAGFDVAAITTKRVDPIGRDRAPAWLWPIVKAGREALAIPARLLDKGHDMIAMMQKP